MIKEKFSFPSAAGGCRIEAVRFLPEDRKVRGTLQLLHGMQEHIGRYDGMAKFFTSRGWAVYGHSHIGHGHSTNEQYPLGYFGRKNAEGRVFRADARAVHNRAKKDFPDLPMVLFGYSMGSFVCRHCLADFGDELSAAVVCATGNGDKALNLSIASAKTLSIAFGRKDAILIDRVVQKGFAERTEKKTNVDWLSTDLSYLLKDGKPDPLCGFPFSYSGYHDLLTMIRAMLRDETFDGSVWALAIPEPVIKLSDDIDEWLKINSAKAQNVYSSENISSSGYSYQKSSAADLKSMTWQSIFSQRLNRWRKL